MKSDPGGGAATISRQATKPPDDSVIDTPSGSFTFHPLVREFPRPTPQKIEAMAEEIRRRGGTAPILHVGETIVDDFARIKACQLAGVPLVFQSWDGSGSLAEVVTRAILPQYPLSESQRAAIAVPISDWLKDDTTAARNRAGTANLIPGGKTQKPHSKQTTQLLQNCSNSGIVESCGNPADKTVPNLPAMQDQKRIGRAVELAAKYCDVSPRYVFQALSLRENHPWLYEEVRVGKTTLSKASVAASKKSRQAKAQEQARQRPRPLVSEDDVIVGDCLKVMAGMPDGAFPFIFADPPYNLGWKYDSDPTKDMRSRGDYLDFSKRWINGCARLLSPGGSIFVLIDSRWQNHLCTLLEEALGWSNKRNTIAWCKNFPQCTDAQFQPATQHLFYFTRGGKFTWNPDAVRIPSVRDEIEDARRVHADGIVPHDNWRIPLVTGNSEERVWWDDAPPQVPAALLERCILAASNEGDRVFDPFTGNGTTWKAAKKLGRKFTGIERSKLYADRAKEWVEGKS